MRRIITLSLVILASAISACSNADATPKDNAICGTVDTMFMGPMYTELHTRIVDSAGITNIKFKDGRSIKFDGIAKIDIWGGKIYSFPMRSDVVQDIHFLNGPVVQVKTYGEIATPDSTTKPGTKK